MERLCLCLMLVIIGCRAEVGPSSRGEAPFVEAPFVEVPAKTRWRLDGVVAAIGDIPRPSEVTYPDYIVAVHLQSVRVRGEQRPVGQALVFVWAMRQFELTRATRLRIGDHVAMEVRPWSEVAPALGTVARGELYQNTLMLQDPCWGEIAAP